MATRRKLFWGAFALVIALAVACVALLASRTTRTESYFALQRKWAALWPFERGKSLYLRLKPVLEPFVPVRVSVEPHVSLLLDPYDYVSRTILESGVWEPETGRELSRHLQVGATFIDVGAHIGYHSLRAAVAVGPHGHVIAIEPNPETVRTLRDNISESGATTIVVHPVACWDLETTLEFFASLESNTGESSLSARKYDADGPTQRTLLSRPCSNTGYDYSRSRDPAGRCHQNRR